MAISIISLLTGRTVTEATSSPQLAIFTDAPNAESLPRQVRGAAETAATENLSVLFGERLPPGVDGAIVWLRGEELLKGKAEDLRCDFFSAKPYCTLVPVHLPCLVEADLVSVQPRMLAVGAKDERLSNSVRISGTATLSTLARSVFERSEEPWARLHLALLKEQPQGAGLEDLQKLWSQGGMQRAIQALVLRNIILVLLRQKKFEKAETLLAAGFDVFPDYADLMYLHAIKCAALEKYQEALTSLTRALASTGRDYVGSGGENTYRASWLRGTIMESAGNQQKALYSFLPGLHQSPSFRLSVLGILRQRMSREGVRQLQLSLCELVRREPQYLEPVFDFHLRHRELDAPRRLLRTLPLTDAVRHNLQSRLDEAEAMYRPASNRLGPGRSPGVVLQGPFLMHSSYARINREIGLALLEAKSLDSALEQFEFARCPETEFKGGATIREGLRLHPRHLDLTIRHQWPPNFSRPESGKLACILPWEHLGVPRAWVREIQRNVDELWVPSQFVATAFAEGGVDADRIQVIPNGVDPDVFNTSVEPWRPTGCRECVFLFVGGTIRRKGIDLLIRAYLDAFSPGDDVTLIVKDIGASSFYSHNNLLGQVQSVGRRKDVPHIVAMTNEMDDRDLARLYRGCDALVLPYRGEGFGFPLIEAMACGRAVVTTAAGPAIEFCSPVTSYLIQAEETPVPDEPPSVGGLSREWTWFEPDLVELSQTLRRVYEHKDEAARRGRAAAANVHGEFEWPRITRRYLDRILSLTRVETPDAAVRQQFAGAVK